MVIEGDSSFTTPDTTLLCNPSSVNLEGGSSYVHLDDYIEWDTPRVIPRVFPLMFGHTVTLNLLETIVEVGSAQVERKWPEAWLGLPLSSLSLNFL